MFSRNAPERQQKMLQDAIVAVIDHVEDAAWLTQTLTAMGTKHVDYGVTPEMYGWVGTSLLATLAEIAGPAWTREVEVAWTEAYGAISALMIQGAKAT
jgi:hemoglobin-like flavoprotein